MKLLLSKKGFFSPSFVYKLVDRSLQFIPLSFIWQKLSHPSDKNWGNCVMFFVKDLIQSSVEYGTGLTVSQMCCSFGYLIIG